MFLLFGTDLLFGQIYPNVYRPPGQDWKELKTEHFRILFPSHAESDAIRAARRLELEYPNVQKLTGGSLRNFPFILNTQNDLSNGFVSPLPFRAEADIPASAGKSMNPRSGDWLEHVVTHELVHALHMSVNPFGLTSLIGLYSPDLRRSVHSAAPLGVLEGVAVEYESHGYQPNGGRGNYPWFTQQFHSNAASGSRWSMGELFQISSQTLPFDRHYIGSYFFSHWLIQNYGDEAIRKTISVHYQLPFLGYGFALRTVTGKWPSTLYQTFREETGDHRVPASAERTSIRPGLQGVQTSLKGARIRRPLWIDEETLLFHGRFYNAPSGFYRYSPEDGHSELLTEIQPVEDYRYSYLPEKSEILYSAYEADPLYDRTFQADLYRYHLDTDTHSRVTNGERMYAPVPGPELLALQTHGSVSRLATVNPETGTGEPYPELPPGVTIRELLRHPEDPTIVAVIARIGTRQGIWITLQDNLRHFYSEKPALLFENGSLFDLDWHPEQYRLLFSSDHSGVLNLYEYNLPEDSLFQVTDAPYNAFEGSYSPDGERIAYILQERSETLLQILQRNRFVNRPISRDRWAETEFLLPQLRSETASQPVDEFHNTPLPESWTLKRHRSGIGWLWPRTLIPFTNRIGDEAREIGLTLMGTNTLSTQTYDLSVSGIQKRAWVEVNYQNTQFSPGFGLSLYHRARFPLIQDLERARTPTRFLLRQQGLSFNIPFRITLEQNTRLSSLEIKPEYSIARYRFSSLDDPDNGLTDDHLFHSASLSFTLNYRLRQFTRDFQPNAGWTFFARLEADFTQIPFRFEHRDYQFGGRYAGSRGVRAGFYTYASPFSHWNQSLRLGAQLITQTRNRRFQTDTFLSDAFRADSFRGIHNLAVLETRYTIPLGYPDNGGLLIPAYLGGVYLTLFSQTVGDLNQSSLYHVLSNSRTVAGAGVRARFRISNLMFDIGIGFGYEPARQNWSLLLGNF